MKIGVVHGVNVPGKGGVIQVFLSMDPTTAEIKSFFFSAWRVLLRASSGAKTSARNSPDST